MTRGIDRIRGAAVVGALLVLVLAWNPTPAYAHATLVSSSPSEGERLAAAPTTVSFEFSEEMSAPAYVVVTPPDDEDLLVGDPDVDGNVVRQQVRPGGSEGTWTTAVRAVSQDGHPVTAQITFNVGAGVGDDSSAASAESDDDEGSATSTSPDRDGGGWSRTQTDVAVGAGLFLLAGLLLVLARRSPR